ncbi:hypothetical protein P8C59_003356 [Phyllachora maydis]|uniref:Ribosome biogenesis regulatory protein n=1 Tax=Phyllachora maydis TaxID=1825666 RepID=A0AAD9I0I4_9PEZI|nr:hypothetical protein P8C59_003356 [Phyllachora maydis]
MASTAQVVVQKPTPYNFDLGLLLASDPNPLALDAANVEGSLGSAARDGTQALVNQLLLTCPIKADQDGVVLSLPAPATALPREKPVPAPAPPTKWQAFARRKGIRPKTREQRRNLRLNEDTGAWERKWGYKGANKAGVQEAPIIEVDARKEAAREEGTSVRGDKRREIRERVKRNERRMRKNQRNAEGR